MFFIALYHSPLRSFALLCGPLRFFALLCVSSRFFVVLCASLRYSQEPVFRHFLWNANGGCGRYKVNVISKNLFLNTHKNLKSHTKIQIYQKIIINHFNCQCQICSTTGLFGLEVKIRMWIGKTLCVHFSGSTALPALYALCAFSIYCADWNFAH